jgi:predicted nuclease of predicted toxin-antitoxin system
VRFLADESCDFGVVRTLRASGFDVAAVAQMSPRATDEAVIALAVLEDRILLTEDKDFGQLVYASGRPSTSVILIRYPGKAREDLFRTIDEVARLDDAELRGSFIVVQPGRIRVRRVPKR